MIKLLHRSLLNILLTGLIVSVAMACSSKVSVSDKVDNYIKTQIQDQHIPGIAVAVIKEGEVLISKGYGLANVEHQVPVKPETIFQSGSVGKQFTATAIMMLVEDGKINLDDQIGKYLPNIPKNWEKMTIRNLLTHTSGLVGYPNNSDARHDYTEDEQLKLIETMPLAFQPGEQWAYSNVGYITLGILIHKVTGKFYGEFLKERIFKPLNMQSARIISEEDIIPNRAAGYRLVNGELKNQEWISPSVNTTADGSIYLSLLDMIKWDAALNTETILKKASFKQMWTPVKLNSGQTHPYGFGWGLNEGQELRRIEHGGSWQGFTSYILRDINKNLTVIVFINLSKTKPGAIANKIADIYSD